jgi:TfoX/Sxy family transcriptional regulator of competence genes
MSCDPLLINSIVQQLQPAGDIRSRAMFGEYALYCNDKVVALICNNTLFVKVTEGASEFLDDTHLAPPYPGSKNLLSVPKEKLQEDEWLCDFIRHTAEFLPAPKPKRKK